MLRGEIRSTHRTSRPQSRAASAQEFERAEESTATAASAVGRGASSRVGISSTWSLAGTTTEERERTDDMLAGTSENDRRMPKPPRAQKTWKRKIRAGAPWITVARSAKTGNRFGREEDSNSNSTSVTHVQGFPHNIVSYCSVGKCYITVKHK